MRKDDIRKSAQSHFEATLEHGSLWLLNMRRIPELAWDMNVAAREFGMRKVRFTAALIHDDKDGALDSVVLRCLPWADAPFGHILPDQPTDFYFKREGYRGLFAVRHGGEIFYPRGTDLIARGKQMMEALQQSALQDDLVLSTEDWAPLYPLIVMDSSRHHRMLTPEAAATLKHGPAPLPPAIQTLLDSGAKKEAFVEPLAALIDDHEFDTFAQTLNAIVGRDAFMTTHISYKHGLEILYMPKNDGANWCSFYYAPRGGGQLRVDLGDGSGHAYHKLLGEKDERLDVYVRTALDIAFKDSVKPRPNGWKYHWTDRPRSYSWDRFPPFGPPTYRRLKP